MKELKPTLDQEGIRLVAIGIGYPEIGKEFCEHTGFAPENLYADPENAAYEALELQKSITALAFNPRTPFALVRRVVRGDAGFLTNALAKWKIWIPPKLNQGLQQGGAYVFAGKNALFEHKDAATGAFADLNEILKTAQEGRCEV